MSTVPVYMVINLKITQAENYRVYEKGVFPLFKKYGASLITFDDNPETFEGESPRSDRMIIVQFPSEKNARDWYADPDYQSLSEHRRAGTTLEFLTMVRGLPPR